MQIFRLAVPLSLQQLLGSAMEMIDSLMVSWIGMVSAVGSASQLIIIANTISWGMLSGTSIFAAQYYGKKDEASLKKIFFLSLVMVFMNALFWFGLITLFPEAIIRFYISDSSTVAHAMQYLTIAKYSLLIEAAVFTFSYLYRSIQMAQFTLKVSVFSMIANIVLNYILIFGFGPIPAMQVRGAAYATLIAHVSSLLIYISYGFAKHICFLGSRKEMTAFHFDYAAAVFNKVLPLMINETLFGIGCSLLVKALGVLGKDALEAYYIGDQIAAFFSFIIWGYGGSVQIVLSHKLGEGKINEAKQMGRYVLGLTALLSLVLSVILLTASPLLIRIYHIQSDTIQQLTQAMLLVFTFRIAFRIFNFTIFSILRSGGDSKIISLLDCGIMWTVAIPLAYLSIYLFNIEHVALVYLISQSEQLIRFLFGIKRIKSGYWANDLTVIS